MRVLASAVLLSALLGAGGAYAQSGYSRLDHDVQRMWDDTFNPGPRGDPRTNWERRRDADRWEWCRYHPESRGCGYYR
ncbi:MAG TPA: hypothetical protein VE650_09165 [Acetobacteraceae bacterium]|jgi:hypothetical protein|nr:hypothetical protein [Acetobacteraceae bacterium]